jgi:hypothetical protein
MSWRKVAEERKLLQTDIDSVQKGCIGNYVKIDILKTSIIYFTRKTKNIYFSYSIGAVLIVRHDCIKDFGVML